MFLIESDILDMLINIKKELSELREAIEQPPDRWISVSTAAEYAGKSRDWILKKLDSGEIYGHRENERGKWTIDRKSIDSYYLQNANRVARMIEEMV